jgi:hypothetical protein
MTFVSQSSATALPSSTYHNAVIAFRAPIGDFYAHCDATATDIQDLEEYLLPPGVAAYSIVRASDSDNDPGAGEGEGDGDDDDGALDNLPDLPPDDGDPDGGDDGDDGEDA